MCIGSIARLVETWDEDGVRIGRLADGCVVSLSFVPDAVGAWRVRATFHGTRSASPSRSDYARLTVGTL